MWCEYLSGSRFPIPDWLPFLTQPVLELAVFLTHPFLETKITLKTNKIQILELKDDCFLFHSAKADPGTGRAPRARPCQGQARAAAPPPHPNSVISVHCWPGLPTGGRTGALRSGLASEQFPHRTRAREVVPNGPEIDSAQPAAELGLESTFLPGLPSQPRLALPAPG